MNTWTCKGLALGLAGLVALGGCDEALLTTSGATPQEVRMVDLGSGAVTLVAPSGFCVDPRSTRARFALMARCDTLGIDGFFDAPLALITATAVNARSDGPITTDDLGAGSEAVLNRIEQDGITVLQVQGTPPKPSLRGTYWRAASRVGTQIVGLTLYQSNDAHAIGNRAAQLLIQTLERTRAQSGAPPPADNSATTTRNRRGVPLFSGLFE
ncbi:MAG: hypothetical protein AAFP87_01445 [Pseudomonadota bacterium]